MPPCCSSLTCYSKHLVKSQLNTKTQRHKGLHIERLFFVSLCLCISWNRLSAQIITVLDAVTHQPVAHASLYTKEDGRFHSCVSNEQGVAHITFQWQRLTVSHLNYEQRVLRSPSTINHPPSTIHHPPSTIHHPPSTINHPPSTINHPPSTITPDTIFLQPRYRDVGQVVVTNREPEWIRRCLKRVVKQKETLYYGHEGYERFEYHTQSLGTNSIYRMTLTGLLRHKSPTCKHYAMQPDTARIVAADSTRLTDTSNLRRMLYEDFIADLDNGFIRHHRFYANYEYRGQSPDEIELRFRSPKNADDHGTLVIDTLRCTIVKAYRHTGTKTNRQERIDALMYRMAQVFGYRIDTFIRDYRVSYAYRADGTLYPAEVSYKLVYGGRDGDYDKTKEEFSEQTGGGFPNMEATLVLNEELRMKNEEFLDLPPSWYIKYNTDADRQKEIELSSLPAVFSIYEDD